MSKKTTYIILIIAVLGVVGLYFYNKYNVAPVLQITQLDVVDEQSAKFDIGSLKGKKVIVSFYASWCPPCREELEILNKIKDQKLAGIEILAITDEGVERLLNFKQQKQYPFTFLTLNAPFGTIGINSIPVTYLLNTKGEIVYNNVGYIEWDDESTVEHLKALME
ncbi:MAG: alkyl hydroperoxide reductase/Thiol specific antioxidant/Mal allergen [Bacteroidetes bacterium]|jgi:thiol-disulfide isomerase/thioredoxin|nr:alkyl hydroperoxide reductase/Thiol specific antioxidant/Mal allergen [Bacteroidota bacterium]MDF2451574.1 alkyl hydroperoxide reductase/Thiol specific antioxidant/Mal allergen [Bacteroidota bacterium]